MKGSGAMYKIVEQNTGMYAKNLYGYVNSFTLEECADIICRIYNSRNCIKTYKVIKVW